MDPGSIGALAGLGILSDVGVTVYIYDKCMYRAPPPISKPLLVQKKSFKVKNLFNHVQF